MDEQLNETQKTEKLLFRAVASLRTLVPYVEETAKALDMAKNDPALNPLFQAVTDGKFAISLIEDALEGKEASV